MTRQRPASTSEDLRALFGDIDIYLFDQLVRGRFDHRARVLDAGCGGGRNLPYFLSRGFDVFAIDRDAAAVAAVSRLFAQLAPQLPADHVRHGEVHALPWADGCMDAVISSAVLHFARDVDHFNTMVREMWRVLAPGGLFFARLASSITIEAHVDARLGRVRLPDGSTRFIVDAQTLAATMEALGGRAVDPLKTTNVEHQRAMTTWVLEKGWASNSR